ncbi:MAG: hypothetical protein FJ368_02425 [Pelagibacterales bacterium]|nr:hypothetical protein [Pelagibacterales bacterium]
MKKIILTFLSLSLILNFQLFSVSGKFNTKKTISLEEENKSLSEEIICDGSDSENDKELKYLSSNLFAKKILLNTANIVIKNDEFSLDFISSISTPPPNSLS